MLLLGALEEKQGLGLLGIQIGISVEHAICCIICFFRLGQWSSSYSQNFIFSIQFKRPILAPGFLLVCLFILDATISVWVKSEKFLTLQEPLSFRRKVVCKETQLNPGRSLGRERWGQRKHSEIIPWLIWSGAEVRDQAERVDVLGIFLVPCFFLPAIQLLSRKITHSAKVSWKWVLSSGDIEALLCPSCWPCSWEGTRWVTQSPLLWGVLGFYGGTDPHYK